jgi:mycoredoxin
MRLHLRHVGEKIMLKFKKPRLIHFLIALVLAVLIVDRGTTYLYEPKPGSKDIILYTTAWCPYCESLRAYLKGYNIPYIERDVEKSLSGALGWWTLGRGRGVPISVIGEQVVRGYDLPKIDAALRALGYSIRNPEATGSTAEDTRRAGWDSLLTGAREAAGEQGCAPPEDFHAFYRQFKGDEDFKAQRTRFPLRKHVLSGSKPYLTTDEVAEVEESQVLTGQEYVYLDHELLEAGGYYETYDLGESQSEVTVSPEGSPEPVTIHKFQKESGCWFLTELVSYEYFGSLMILK